MAKEFNQRVADLAFMERQLGEMMRAGAERIADPEVRSLTKGVAEDHYRQASRLSELVSSLGGARDVPADVRESGGKLLRRLDQARGQDGLIEALREAERQDAERHRALLKRDDVPDSARELLQQLDAEESEHMNFFENRAPAMAPDIGGSRSMPGKGTGAF